MLTHLIRPGLSRLAGAGLAIILVSLQVEAAPLFEEHTVLEIELAGPLQKLTFSKSTNDEFPFTLRASGVKHQVQVRTRGNSRLFFCKFPPLRLNFVANTAANSVFEDQDKLKLVTHCRNRDRAEQDMLQEYIAYRILNLLSENSYRVRLLRISYSDIDKSSDTRGPHRYAFLIESAEELAARTGATNVKLKSVKRSSLDLDQAALVFIFQYLVGNTDWSIVKAEGDEYCCHNVELFEIDSSLFAVPYDFDQAGVVNATYAKPHPSLRIRRVTQRQYRGYCIPPDALRSALRSIMNKRLEIVGLPASTPGLSPKETATTTKYLDGFFKKVGDPRKMVDDFQSRCL